jgi:hypothetical protein
VSAENRFLLIIGAVVLALFAGLTLLQVRQANDPGPPSDPEGRAIWEDGRARDANTEDALLDGGDPKIYEELARQDAEASGRLHVLGLMGAKHPAPCFPQVSSSMVEPDGVSCGVVSRLEDAMRLREHGSFTASKTEGGYLGEFVGSDGVKYAVGYSEDAPGQVTVQVTTPEEIIRQYEAGSAK